MRRPRILDTACESDSAAGPYYNRVRYYDPNTGRFLNEDPIGFNSGTDFYAYVSNNSTNLVDPSGLNAGAPAIPWPWWGPGPGEATGTAVGVAGRAVGAAIAALLDLTLLAPSAARDEDVKDPKYCDRNRKKDDPCRIMYDEDVAWCLETFSDLKDLQACLAIASLNFERCKNNQEPVKRDPRDHPKPKKSPFRKPNE